MKLILTADVPNLGGPGDIVEVKDGYGRNLLLPRKLAIVATRGAEKQVESIRRAQKAREIRDLGHAKQVARRSTVASSTPARSRPWARTRSRSGCTRRSRRTSTSRSSRTDHRGRPSRPPLVTHRNRGGMLILSDRGPAPVASGGS